MEHQEYQGLFNGLSLYLLFDSSCQTNISMKTEFTLFQNSQEALNSLSIRLWFWLAQLLGWRTLFTHQIAGAKSIGFGANFDPPLY